METIEQLGDDLCKYCSHETDKEFTQFHDGCQGMWCEDAYQSYLEENSFENELILEENKNGK